MIFSHILNCLLKFQPQLSSNLVEVSIFSVSSQILTSSLRVNPGSDKKFSPHYQISPIFKSLILQPDSYLEGEVPTLRSVNTQALEGLYPFTSSLMWNLRPNLFSTSSSPFRGDKKNKGSFSSGASNKSKGHQSKSPEGCVAFPVKSWQLLFALLRRADLAVLSACQFENLNKLNRHWLLKLQQISAFWNMAG